MDNPNPCRHIIQEGTFYFCGIYENRPNDCAAHDFPQRFCPIGHEKLHLDTPDKMARRIDEGHRITRSL